MGGSGGGCALMGGSGGGGGGGGGSGGAYCGKGGGGGACCEKGDACPWPDASGGRYGEASTPHHSIGFSAP